MVSIDQTWLRIIRAILQTGKKTLVRGRAVRELFNVVYEYAATSPIISVPQRKLNYKFMAADASWVIEGREDVEYLAQYNKSIKNYAPLGDKFYGAYGPRFVEQLDYVVNALIEDRFTRQACMTFWRPNPPAGVDIPCNDFLAFSIRDGLLNLSVTARSKDAWMGLPYDAFTFALILYKVATLYNGALLSDGVGVGSVTFFDVNCHLYEDDVPKVEELLANKEWDVDLINLGRYVDPTNWAYCSQLLSAMKEEGYDAVAKLWLCT